MRDPQVKSAARVLDVQLFETARRASCSTVQLGDAVSAELDARCTAGLAQVS